MPSKTSKKQRRYTNAERKSLLHEFHESSMVTDNSFCQRNHIPSSTWYKWRSKEQAIMSNVRHGRLPTMGGQGKKTALMPFKEDLLAYIKERRDKEKFLRVFHLMLWIKRNHRAWLQTYLETKKSMSSGYEALSHLMHRFCARNRFSLRSPCVNKVRQVVLDEVWIGYAVHFWAKYAQYDKAQIFNADETGVYFDMPPGKTLAEIGKSSKVDKSSKHSERISG